MYVYIYCTIMPRPALLNADVFHFSLHKNTQPRTHYFAQEILYISSVCREHTHTHKKASSVRLLHTYIHIYIHTASHELHIQGRGSPPVGRGCRIFAPGRSGRPGLHGRDDRCTVCARICNVYVCGCRIFAPGRSPVARIPQWEDPGDPDFRVG